MKIITFIAFFSFLVISAPSFSDTICNGNVDQNGNFSSRCRNSAYKMIQNEDRWWAGKPANYSDDIGQMFERINQRESENSAKEARINEIATIYNIELKSLLYPVKSDGYRFIDEAEFIKFESLVRKKSIAMIGSVDSDQVFIKAINVSAAEAYQETLRQRKK